MAAVLFIFSLHWMNTPKTARRGVMAGVAGMALAIIATWIQPQIVHHGWILIAMIAGGLAGIPLAMVSLTAVPQRHGLVARFRRSGGRTRRSGQVLSLDLPRNGAAHTVSHVRDRRRSHSGVSDAHGQSDGRG